MPPSASRGSIGALIRFKCLNTSLQPRSFSTTSSLAAIGPENPKFIEIPTTLQPQVAPKRVIKGVLPPPRNLFPNRVADKTTPKYFEKTTPEPQHGKPPANDYVAWKQEMAETRRRNLKEGLIELRTRKTSQDGLVAGRSSLRSAKRERRVYRPQREDERLTGSTITASMRQLQRGALPDPQRDTRVTEKRARVAVKEAEKEEARRAALHTLYMNARTFITTEEQLDERIEEIFIDKPFQSESRSIWDAKGAPKTVQDMLSTINHSQKSAVLYGRGPAQITGERIKKIAEELTGGKMD
ncbi:hypothetical protein BGZ60DRAFT_408008 [Tricladium varicosporioides]|nr:hypothetical protein BGZ60DRAFT_408008 [Hymenoscyphus varicosporioides]